jgi:hypothetical protein
MYEILVPFRWRVWRFLEVKKLFQSCRLNLHCVLFLLGWREMKKVAWFVFDFILQSQFVMYYFFFNLVLIILFSLPFCAILICLQFHPSIQFYDILCFLIWLLFFWFLMFSLCLFVSFLFVFDIILQSQFVIFFLIWSSLFFFNLILIILIIFYPLVKLVIPSIKNL